MYFLYYVLEICFPNLSRLGMCTYWNYLDFKLILHYFKPTKTICIQQMKNHKYASITSLWGAETLYVCLDPTVVFFSFQPKGTKFVGLFSVCSLRQVREGRLRDRAVRDLFVTEGVTLGGTGLAGLLRLSLTSGIVKVLMFLINSCSLVSSNSLINTRFW